MNKLCLILAFTLSLGFSHAQNKLSHEAIIDFRDAARASYLLNDNFYIRTNYYFRSIKKKDDDAETAIESIPTNADSRNLIIKSFGDRILSANEGYVLSYLVNGMGMRPAYAIELAKFIKAKYK